MAKQIKTFGAGNDVFIPSDDLFDPHYEVHGGGGNDVVHTWDGNDVLYGGAGQDRIEGGAGADTFVYRTVNDSSIATYDKIVGFDFGSDKIDLSKVDADITTAGNQAFSFYGMEAPVFGSPGALWAEQSGAGIKILADVNGDLQADFMAVVFGIDVWNSTFQSSDFIL
jgi:Ca2+-binding RTX toxin-like protein